jgi:hypothetical protein
MSLKFKASIKPGAAIFHDHGFYRWPDAGHPQNPPVKFYPEIEFEAEMSPGGEHFNLRRPGYGILGGAHDHYGNGSISVSSIHDLVVSDRDLAKVVNHLRSKTREKLDAAVAEVVKLEKDMAALSQSNGVRQRSRAGLTIGCKISCRPRLDGGGNVG